MSGGTMNAGRLLEVYEQISEAPDAIARLRRFVLDLAVRGKLVEQNAGDEPAAELLKRITADRDRLIELGKIKKSKALPDVSKDEEQFPPPFGWSWSRLGGVTFITQGFAFKSGDYSSSADDGLPLIKIGDIGSNSPEVFIKGSYDKRYLVQPGQLLLGLSGSIKCSVWNGPTALLNQRIARILPASSALTDGWLFLVVENSLEKWKSETSKLTVQNIKAKQLSEAPVPLPPLAEQHRIVAKVDELMALCDRLEEARKTRKELRDKLTAASLARLTAPDTTAEDFPTHAAFALEALPALTARPDQIKTLRQTILNLAVCGKLVEQDPADEPASRILDKFRAKKLELRRETGDARIKPAADAIPSGPWLNLPKGWEVQSFENLFLFIDYRGKTPPKTEKGVPLITAKNVRIRSLNRDPREFIAASTFEKWMTRGFPRLGDIFFTTEAPLAYACLNDIEEPFALAQRVVCLQPYAEINTRFLVDAMASDLVQEMIDREATGMTAKGIKTAKLKPLALPIPPLAEQHRIVAKVNALMALCDRLEAALTTADTTRTRLLEALLHEALEPTTDTMEAAE